MIFLLKILTVYSIISVVLTFKAINICRREITNSVYDKIECYGEYNYKCGAIFCTLNKESCDSFQQITSSVIRSLISAVLNRTKLRNYEKLLRMIEDCPLDNAIYILNKENFTSEIEPFITRF